MLEKTYQPAQIEARIHAAWTEAEAFRSGRSDRLEAKAEPYCIVIPPPNVTGSLHMGHALNNTLQDILCRFERMRGKDVLWQPGTDHAGIATQMVVERQMMERQEPDRRSIGRERFVEKVWTWKEQSGGTITNQLRRLGASCDWSRERFTMDPGLSAAVLKVFVELYREGLIYKDKRLVNWDPKFQTAISDLEVVQIDARGTFKWSADSGEDFDPAALAKALKRGPGGHMYYFRYPLTEPVPGYDRDYLVVATTRPETMLGDTAVAVHPEDERYAALIAAGATVTLPLAKRRIPVVADDYSDPEKGTGAVKITPAHDFNDFEVGKRHAGRLTPPINIFDAFAQLNENVPEAYRGLDRFVARERVVNDLYARGLLEKIEPTAHTVPHGDRSNVPVEPWLTDQWYVNAEALAKPALAAVRTGKTRFVPERFANDYFRWLENIQPWCISRQLWWGHQIPAWYGPDGQVFVAYDEKEAQAQAKTHYKKAIQLTRDPDVLDTWFSSALWPFSTLGWPDRTPELARYYPTSTLVTGFDIIFFWVARMMMSGLHFMKEVPFRTVYIHGLVRDASGQKMSKSKGNVMDPLDLIDEFGADALRFSLAAMASQGSDVKFSRQRVEGYRNFATKLWNASRFAEMNECVRQRDFNPRSVELTINKWIAGETQRAANAITDGIEVYKFNEAAGALYEFVWGQFCDWYLELIKPILAGDDERAKIETRAMVAWVLDQILKMLHPFMPFITEELWAHMVVHGEKRGSLLALSQWPVLSGLDDEDADREIGWVVRLISEVRSIRTEMNVPAGAKIPLVLVNADAAIRERGQRNEDTIKRLARLDTISHEREAPKGAALVVVGETTAALPLAGVIDMAAERKRLEKEIASARSDLGKMDAKLSNPSFVERAKPEAVEEARERKIELEAGIAKWSAALKRIET